jgi:hypothetical protein
MRNQQRNRIVDVAASMVLIAHTAYDGYAFIYLEMNHGVWLSPLGVLNPAWFLPIAAVNVLLAVILLTRNKRRPLYGCCRNVSGGANRERILEVFNR